MVLARHAHAPAVHWIQLAGTAAVVTVDYCALARLLTLAPWNRREPLSLALVGRTLFSAPVQGSFLEAMRVR